jgi:hypothetical protein
MPVELLTAQDANWNLERGAFNVLIDQSQPALPCRAARMTSVMLFERQPPTAGRSRPSAPDIWRLLSAGLPTPCCYALRVSTALRSMPMLALRGSALAPSGAIWYRGHPSWVSLPCMARPRALALWVTRLVAASASTLASTGWLPIG